MPDPRLKSGDDDFDQIEQPSGAPSSCTRAAQTVDDIDHPDKPRPGPDPATDIEWAFIVETAFRLRDQFTEQRPSASRDLTR